MLIPGFWPCLVRLVMPVGNPAGYFPTCQIRKNKENVPETWRRVKYLLPVAILILALFGNLTLLFLDPITIWVRTMAGAVMPGMDYLFSGSEKILSNVPGLSDPLSRLDQLLRPALFPQFPPPGLRFPWIPAGLFTGILLLNFIASRFWCRYLCPLGGITRLAFQVLAFQTNRRIRLQGLWTLPVHLPDCDHRSAARICKRSGRMHHVYELSARLQTFLNGIQGCDQTGTSHAIRSG